ncbi:hypothetical protein B0H17DRAFT_1138071 [Mycena rosella]|uniref:Uncharacterized protein n=1 Tax=Mycena rosella TaxID=1033263 RepID=A0AAD7D784_MYCRO|nr:hypothetical protein B0H17DRAFT_1138071 [Mycena rosella]
MVDPWIQYAVGFATSDFRWDNSAQATPTGLSAPGSSDFSDLGADDEDDVKPSVDSLNEYRRRARSHENAGADAANKIPNVEELDEFGRPIAHANGFGAAEVVLDVPMAEEAAEEHPVAYGKSLALHTLTALMRFAYSERRAEADHDLMTPEEYTAFSEIMQEQM